MTRRSTMLPGMAPKSLVTGVLRRMAPRFLVIGAALVLAACAGEAGPEGPSGATGTGEACERGGDTNCAGCHGTEGAKARINAGLPPHDPSVEGVVNVSPYDCRTCHNIHTTYTKADFALTGGEQPVFMERAGGTFDGGKGNLCANCH